MRRQSIKIHHQAGFATLAAALVTLAAATLITLFSAQAIVTEFRVAKNTYNTEQAFEAAQAGLDYGVVYIDKNKATITNGQVVTGSLDNGSTYSVQINFVGPTNQLIKLVSTGMSSDGTATRVVAQMSKFMSVMVNIPNTPLKVKGQVDLSGNSIISNLEGSTTINTGDSAVSISGNGQTILSSGVSSNASTLGPDIVQGNGALSGMTEEEFQIDTLGTTINNLMSQASPTYNNSGSTDYSSTLSGVEGKVIGINQNGGTASISSNTTVGSPSNPVVIIVQGNISISGNSIIYGAIIANGNVSISGNSHVHGLVFATGNSSITSTTGNSEVYGAVISGNQYNTSGNAHVYYNSNNLNKITQLVGSYGRLSGSWQDLGI